MNRSDEARRERIRQSYDELRLLDRDAWERCIEAAEAIAINHGLPLHTGAAVETAMIELVLEEKRRHG